MKNIFLFLLIMYFLLGCSDHKLTHKEVVTTYYRAFDSANYNEIEPLINDTIIIVSGDYVTPYNNESFYKFFKWDSIFKSSYEIIELEEKNSHIFVTLAQDNVRNEFLKNNPLMFKVKFFFTSGKISKLEELEYINVNWNVWNKEKDSLVSWIKNNHPELDGFVNELTMKGARNYLEAIKLYEKERINVE